MDSTVIYYTSNKENILFEKKIMERLKKAKGYLPLISVSQKPINFGNCNICVGDIGVSDGNAFKQMLIGCERAKTDFVIFAEADTLYPPEYFQYEPKELKRYWFEDVYVWYPHSPMLQDNFFLKGRSDCGHIAGRKLAIKLLKEGKGRGMKYKGKNRPEKVQLENPIINIKTGDGMRPKTQTALNPVSSLPYWGKVKDLQKEIFGT